MAGHLLIQRIRAITDIGDFLQEEIKGPGSITCKSGKNGERDCRFDEPGMSQ